MIEDSQKTDNKYTLYTYATNNILASNTYTSTPASPSYTPTYTNGISSTVHNRSNTF